MATVPWVVPNRGTRAPMRAQAEALTSVKRFIALTKAERERVTRAGRNRQDR